MADSSAAKRPKGAQVGWGGELPRAAPEGIPSVTVAVSHRLRRGRWTGGAGSRRVRAGPYGAWGRAGKAGRSRGGPPGRDGALPQRSRTPARPSPRCPGLRPTRHPPARCLKRGVVVCSRESREEKMEGNEASEETGKTADAGAGRKTSREAEGRAEGRQR